MEEVPLGPCNVMRYESSESVSCMTPLRRTLALPHAVRVTTTDVRGSMSNHSWSMSYDVPVTYTTSFTVVTSRDIQIKVQSFGFANYRNGITLITRPH